MTTRERIRSIMQAKNACELSTAQAEVDEKWDAFMANIEHCAESGWSSTIIKHDRVRHRKTLELLAGILVKEPHRFHCEFVTGMGLREKCDLLISWADDKP